MNILTATFILVIQIGNDTPEMIAEYDQLGDCVEISVTLDSAMTSGEAWCEDDHIYQ